MADKPWKKHERDVAKFFETDRALHGIDRSNGEVLTDVFVDLYEWFYESDPLPLEKSKFANTALFVECKYTDKDASSNDWVLRLIKSISDEPGIKKSNVIPVIVTSDGWHWIQLTYFGFYLTAMANRFSPGKFMYYFEVRHINKKMSKFYKSAIEQARMASVPNRLASNDPFTHRMHTVCVGSNARLPKCIGMPPGDFFVELA